MTGLSLQTERLTLRDFRESDWPDVVRRTTSPEVARYMTWDTRTWADRDTVQAWIREQRTFDFSVMDRFREFAVVKDGVNIGDVGLKRLGHTPTLAEIGWVFERAAQGQGYATEAASALIDWSFRNLCVRRVIAICDARNRASSRLMARLGMRREAHHKKSHLVKGVWIDELVYAVLEEEWLERPAPRYTVHAPLTKVFDETVDDPVDERADDPVDAKEFA